MAKAFDKSWRDWVQNNVARDVPRSELLRILTTEGFDFSAAHRELYPLRVPNLVRLDVEGAELYTAEGFLDAAGCRRIVDLMEGRLRLSTITVPNQADPYFRRSKTCDLSLLDDPAVRDLDRRICHDMHSDPALAESTQAQRYDVGDEFKAHTDYFESYELETFSTPTLGQRTWTFMLYLNEPEEGGETDFPSLGVTVKPRTGRAVIWNSLKEDGTPNSRTLHHGMQVRKGFKAVITKWFRKPRSAR